MAGNTHAIRPADPGGIAEGAAVLRAGRLVAVPTETVYGLAARADSAEAVAAIYRAKGRPDFNPLIVHVADLAQGQGLARFDERALALAARFWPGPLTLVLPRRDDAGLAAAVTAGLPTLALRCPAHPASLRCSATSRCRASSPALRSRMFRPAPGIRDSALLRVKQSGRASRASSPGNAALRRRR